MADEEIEEEIVLFELAGLPNSDLIKEKSCYILGVESEKVTIQIGSLVFQGNYEDILGTGLMFEKLPDGTMQLVGKCAKKVPMTRLSIQQNKKPSEKSPEVVQPSSQTSS